MQIQEDEDYEGFGAEYQYQLVRLLDQAMKKAGVATPARRAVAEEFIFDMAMLHDQEGITVEGTKSMPVLAFKEGDAMRVPNPEFELHDYAHGNVDEYFGDE